MMLSPHVLGLNSVDLRQISVSLLALLTASGCASVGTPNYSGIVAQVSADAIASQSPVLSDDNPTLANVCHLTIQRSWAGLIKRTPKTGSAVLYRGRYLLTAAHNIYSPWYNPVESVEVRCGDRNASTTAADQIVSSSDVLTAGGYHWRPFNEDQFQQDFGVLRLKYPIKSTAPVVLRNVSDPLPANVEIAGYPGGIFSTGYQLHTGTGPIISADRNVVSYGIETFTGNSGGPVWSPPPEGPELVAIHVTGSGGRLVDASFRAEIESLIGRLER